MLFLVAGTIDTKFRRSTEVTTANSTNKDPNANKLSWVINYCECAQGKRACKSEAVETVRANMGGIQEQPIWGEVVNIGAI